MNSARTSARIRFTAASRAESGRRERGGLGGAGTSKMAGRKADVPTKSGAVAVKVGEDLGDAEGINYEFRCNIKIL